MSFFKKLSNLFSSPKASNNRVYWVTVKCNRCGEIIIARVDLVNDLSIDYGESDKGTSYICRKTLMGEERCFQRVDVKLMFDANRKLIDREISGGQFADEAESSA